MLTQKILLIDEDPDLVFLIQEHIEAFGFECYAYTSGDDALTNLKLIKPDLILLTIGFTQSEGIQFFDRIGHYLDPDAVCPPVIVINNEDDTHMHNYAFELGTMAYDTIPYRVLSLRQFLTDYLPSEEFTELPL